MAALARWGCAGGLTLLVACASLAELEDPSPLREATEPAPVIDSGNARESGAGPSYDAALLSDAPVDTGVDAPPPCTKNANGQPCEDHDACCSAHCSQAKKCATSCKISNEGCLFHSECCVGLYCKFGGGCKSCLLPGRPVDVFLDQPVRESCCSGQISPTGICQ